MNECLATLSRHGWDRAGEERGKLRFRHAGTGEEVSIAPAEIPFWAAQLGAKTVPAAEWRADRVFVSYGVISGPRHITGITHNRRGERLFFQQYAEAERVAQALNARGEQLEMVLDR